MKFRERYVEEFQSLGINLDELEDLILEKTSEEVQELKNALDEEFQVKKEELKVNADNYKENLEKKNKQMREANKMKNENNKRKGRD
jgi:type VI protein secretion system component VasK